jgi:FkbM family methyltransferase
VISGIRASVLLPACPASLSVQSIDSPIARRTRQDFRMIDMSVLRRVATLLPQTVVSSLNRAQFKYPFLGRVLRRLAGSVATGEGRIHRGPAAGLLIDATGRNAGYVLGTSDPEEQRWLAATLHPGDVFWDLGANIGFFTLLGAHLVGEEGAVVAFEPWPENVQQLQRNIALNHLGNVATVTAAVTASSGRGAFSLPDGRREAGRLGAESGSSIDVATTTIDAEVEAGRRSPDVIKLDIEGAELDALRGGLATIAAVLPTLLVEVHWLGDAFPVFFERELRPLGYMAETLFGESCPIPLTPERFHVVLRPD